MPEVAPNLGEAIGLQAKPIDRTNVIVGEIGRQRREEIAIAEANRKAAAKARADIEKYRNELGKWTISAEAGIHPVYHEKLAMMAEKMRERFMAGQEEHGENYSPAYDPELQKLKFEFQQETDKDRQSTKNIVRDLGVKANDAKGKFEVNESLLNALNIKNYDEFLNANGGSDYYALGLNKPKPEVLGWTKGATEWATKQKAAFIKNPDGSRILNPRVFEEQWAAVKNDPSAEWIENANAINLAAGYTPEQSEAQIKQYILNLLPNQPAPDVSVGPGTGSKAKYAFSEETDYDSALPSGQKAKVTQVTVTKKGGGRLPIDTYTNDKKQEVYGSPTGRVYKLGNTGEVKMEISVPNKDLTTSQEWKDLDDAERQTWLDNKFLEDPNKFEKVSVSITGNEFNKSKFEGSYGKPVQELFKGTSTSSATKGTEEKVVVEKDGKKYRLPKSQLQQAQQEGYKLSK